MPHYDYRHSECNFEFERVYKIIDLEIPLQEPCPNCGKMGVEIIIGAPAIGDPVSLGIQKPDPAFQKMLGRIRDKAGPRSTIGKNSRFNIPREL